MYIVQLIRCDGVEVSLVAVIIGLCNFAQNAKRAVALLYRVAYNYFVLLVSCQRHFHQSLQHKQPKIRSKTYQICYEIGYRAINRYCNCHIGQLHGTRPMWQLAEKTKV